MSTEADGTAEPFASTSGNGPGDEETSDSTTDPDAESESTTGGDEGCPADDCTCALLQHEPCDDASEDLVAAIGLGCPDEVAVVSTLEAPADSTQTRASFGSTDAYAPTEGARYAVLGTGFVSELELATPDSDCSDSLPGFDPGLDLSDPMTRWPTEGDCIETPELVGTGDCSGTLDARIDSQGVYDAAQLRIDVTTPTEAQSVSFESALLTTAVPDDIAVTGDVYIAWLESERWTGNLTFDELGNPLGKDTLFLEYTEDAPELTGTCLQGHAATGWTTTTAPVGGDEAVSLIFAVVDVSWAFQDSFAFVDGVRFGCAPAERPTTTAFEGR